MAIDPNFVADNEDRDPLKAPIGVRAMPTMQTSESRTACNPFSAGDAIARGISCCTKL